MAIRVKLGIAVFVAACLGFGAMAAGASACSCGLPTAKDLPREDASVVARLDEKTVHPVEGSTPDGPATFTYTVIQAFGPDPRLEPGRVFTVRTHTSEAACGLPGQVGRSRGLVLDRDKRRWSANLCTSGTSRWIRRLARKAFPGDGESAATGSRRSGSAPACRSIGRLAVF